MDIVKPPRQNEPWTEDDYTTLNLLWETDADLKDICLALGRSASSVAAQLANKNYVFFWGAKAAYFRVQPPPPPLWTPRTLRELNQEIWPDEKESS